MKIRTVFRWVIGIPLLLALILFTLSNRELVRLGLFPTDFSLEIPLAVALLIAMGFGFFVGGLLVWFATLRHRHEASRAKETVRVMEARHPELKVIPSGTLLAPPR